MRNVNNNLRFLKFTFLRSSTMKLSAVYCFCSFVLVHSAEWIWMEEAVFKSLSAFVIVTSVVPSREGNGGLCQEGGHGRRKGDAHQRLHLRALRL